MWSVGQTPVFACSGCAQDHCDASRILSQMPLYLQPSVHQHHSLTICYHKPSMHQYYSIMTDQVKVLCHSRHKNRSFHKNSFQPITYHVNKKTKPNKKTQMQVMSMSLCRRQKVPKVTSGTSSHRSSSTLMIAFGFLLVFHSNLKSRWNHC